MKNILVFLFAFCMSFVFAQSKKDQIEQLQFSNDSLNRVIEFERNTNKFKLQELNSSILDFQTKVLNQGKTIDSLHAANQSLNNLLILKSKDFERLKESNTANEKKIKTLEDTIAMIQLMVSQLAKEKQNKVECLEREEPNVDNIESPKIISICTFRNLEIRKEGIANERTGRYSYTYEYFKNNQVINPSEIFNSKVFELESEINKKFKSEYFKLSQDPNSDGCFDEISYDNVTFNGELMDNDRYNQIDIDFVFENNNIVFSRSFGLPGACFALDYVSIEFTISELEPYLAK
jgi:hypothetical protein